MLRWLRQLGLRNALFGVSSLSLLVLLAGIWLYVSHDARLLAAIHRGDEAGVLSQLWRTLWLAMVVGFLAFAALLWVLSRVVLTRPLEEILTAARRMGEADLTQTVTLGGTDELAVLAGALNRIGQGLRDTLARVRNVSEAVGTVIDQLSRSGVQVSSGATTIQSQVTETSRSMAEALGAHKEVTANVEALHQVAEESSVRIAEMTRRNEEVAEGVEQMAASVQETTAAIDEMTRSIVEVAKAIEELGGSTEETSFSIKQMDVSIGQVETNANETARLSEQVSAEAASGVQSLQKTLVGIDRIRESSELAARVIEGLGRRVGEVVAILDVIDEVAEQTNLLALNAAIIAAQAGEHGKGFAVVADEIKELAERTGASTKEISELIARMQEESRNAVEAVEQGVRHVQEGVELGRDAETALKRISGTANRSTVMVKAIARATVEQARGSRTVTAAVQRIADTVQSVTQSAQAQARGTAAHHPVRPAHADRHRRRPAAEPGAGGGQPARHPRARRHARADPAARAGAARADPRLGGGAQDDGGHPRRQRGAGPDGASAGGGHRTVAGGGRGAPRRGAPVPSMSARRAPSEGWMVFLIGAVQFVNIWDFVMVMPLGPDFASALGIPLSKLGLVGGAYTAAAAVAGVVGSTFLDRFDRRPALAVTMIGLVLGTFAGGLAWNFESLLAARFLAGAFGGPATSLALSIIADAVPPERRGKAMGAVMGAFSVASVLGVPLSLQLSVWGGWRLPFLVVGGLGLGVTAAVAASLPSLRAHLGRSRQGISSGTAALPAAGAHLVRDDRGDHGQRLPGHPQHLVLPAGQPRAAPEPAAVGLRHRRGGELRHAAAGGKAGGPVRQLPGGHGGRAPAGGRLRGDVRRRAPDRAGDAARHSPLLHAVGPEREPQHAHLEGPRAVGAGALHVLPVRRPARGQRARGEPLGAGALRATRRQPGQRADARPDGHRADATAPVPASPGGARSAPPCAHPRAADPTRSRGNGNRLERGLRAKEGCSTSAPARSPSS